MQKADLRMQNEKSRKAQNPLGHSALSLHSTFGSGFPFGLAQAGDAVALFPLAALLEQFQALETLQNVPFSAQGGRRAQTSML
jgi:hypothetical protein